MASQVWINQEGTIHIQEMDVSGNVLAPVLADDDFVQGVDINPERLKYTFQQPGVSHEERRSFVTGWNISFESWFFSKAEQVSQFVDSAKQYRILFSFNNSETGEDEELDFRNARVMDGPSVNGQENDVYGYKASWFAERLV